MTQAPENFVAFILTHGRPDNVLTYDTLIKAGYTGPVVIVVDDTDKTLEGYKRKFGDKVYVFNKREVAKTFDTADNFDDMRTIVYARNACFDIARELGYRYFVQLDDDYNWYCHRFDGEQYFESRHVLIKSLDRVFGAMLDFLKATPTRTIAMAQGGDFIGGKQSSDAVLRLKRKAMNSFICDVERPIGFLGRINEDVNTYTRRASTGDLFFSFTQVFLHQKQTQANSGGMTDVYLSSGTYVKSFYTVMYHPSSVTVEMMKSRSNPRLHHAVNWRNTTPKILSERHRKASQ